mmetsp:Transcript_16218/g.23811  ORF Transcript_16218/g.23811 Transcript_16218/m.23811 type:complete len:85 (-) Transcript_16218:352-606(-)
MYQEQKSFQGKHKHVILPKHETATKPRCEWLKVQRYQYKLYMGVSGGSRIKVDYRFTEERIHPLEKRKIYMAGIMDSFSVEKMF